MSGQPGDRARAPKEPSLREIVLDDLKRSDLRRSFRRDLDDIYNFYLDDERREKLASMGAFKRFFWFWGWLFKSLLMKLSPARRLILLVAILLLAFGQPQFTSGQVQVSVRTHIVSVGLMFLVLMLELKDKLLARDEIEVARQVQLALLPARHPQPEGWSLWSHTRPANDVGGDLVDYLDLGDGSLAVAVGDVAGKGLGAALLMSKLQATLRATAGETRSLPDLAGRLNTIFCRDGLQNRFATMFYLEIAPGTGRVRFVNAGHNPSFVIRASGVDPLPASGPPLGLFADAVFRMGEIDLQPGESLLVYSDGVTEARNAGDEEFGERRLIEAAGRLRGEPADRAGAALIQEVDRFIGESRPHDDLSLVVLVRRQSRA